MVRRPNPGKCIHCLGDFEQLTWDHIIPLGWYPDTTPEDLDKWKAPACQKCNHSYGELENQIVSKLGLCLDRTDVRASGIPQKVLRAINPDVGKNPKDKGMRQAKKMKLFKELIPLSKLPAHGVLPNFDNQLENSGSNYLGVLVPDDILELFGIKLVRGITYALDQAFIGNSNIIEVYFNSEEASADIYEMIKTKGQTYDIGPGVKLMRALASVDPLCALFYIELWGKLKIFASVIIEE